MRQRFRDPRLHRLFSFQAMYAGLAPDDALAIYAVITYMDSIEGVWFPDGGMHAMPAAMATAAEKAGAMLRYAETVTEVIRRPDNGGVAGVRLESGEQIMADAVVCTLDLPVAYRQLLPDLRPPRAVRHGSYSPSAVVWHVGVRGTPAPEVGHHNIHFGTEWGERLRRPAEARRADAGPVAAGDRALPERSVPGARRVARSSTCSSPYRTCSGRIDWNSESRADAGAVATHSWSARAIPPTWSPRSS